MTPEERLEKVEELIAERDEITAQLLELMGAVDDEEEEEEEEVAPVRAKRQKDKTIAKGTSYARGARPPCSECGSVGSRHFKTCTKSSTNKRGETDLPPQTVEKIIAMRRDGWSANMLETELGIRRAVIGKILKHAGFASKPTSADNMRCAKCKEKGHQASNCPTGDSLDQLDRAEGQPVGRTILDAPVRLNENEYNEVREMLGDGLSITEVGFNYPQVELSEIRRAKNASGYEDYISGLDND
jgi:hypothetical protein